MFLRRGSHRLIGHLLAAVLLGASGTAFAASETLARKTPSDEVTAESVQTRLNQLDGSQGLEESLKTRLRDLYQQALHELESAKTWSGKAARFEQMATSVPRELATAKAALTALPAHPTVVIPPDMTLPQFDQGISKKEAELSQGRTALAELEAEPKRRASQRVEIPKAIAAAKDRAADSDKQLQAAAPADEPSQVTAARRLLLLAQKQAALAEIAACGKEITAYEAMAELTPIRRDLAARQVALAEQEIKQWQEVLNRRREHEAEKQIQRARLEATQAHPAVRRLAQDNAQLAELRKGLAQQIADTVRQLEQTQQRLTALKEQFKRIQEKVDAVGPNNAIGLLLRKQREALPNIGVYRRNIKNRQTAIREGQLALLQLEDRRSALANLEIQVRSALENLDQPNGSARDPALESAVRELLKTEKEYLDALIGDHNSSFDKLVDLDNVEQQVIQETEACARYIDERVLWISSTPAIAFSDLRNAGDAFCWLVRPEGWHEVGHALAADMAANPMPWVFALVVLVPLVRCRGRLRSKLAAIGEQTARANCYRFVPTLEALVLSVTLTAMVPMTLWFIDWRLSSEIDASEWCKAVGSGLASVAKLYFIFGMLGQICHPQGLGGTHFDWNPAGLKLLRGQVRWFLLVALPLVFLSGVLKIQENEHWRDSLGRLCFMAGGGLFSLFLQRALRPGGSVFEAMLANRRGGWLDRLRYVWYPLIVLYPVVLAVAAGAGYYYTSQQLARRVFGTIYLLVGILVLRALLLRWTLVNRRKLAIEQARLRRAAAQADTIAGVEAASPSALPACADPNRDLATINSQTRRLIEYSLALAGILVVWLVWVDVLPALRILNRVQLWQIAATVTESFHGPDGAAALRTVDRLVAVTLADLGLAIFVLATTLIAVKNIPGLLEMGLLQHMPLDAGFRYAVAAVSRYVITLVGILLACNIIGLGWSRVQWLLAAISVGLGFGLQEIFANCVSGLIILFERPIRVGDVITVDTITGIVSRIHMRATTVTNWDRKELIIPNKEFITGRVLNWTLSDQVNRVVINVGIAYGSDTQRASELLLKVAKEHQMVLDDPPPVVTFEAFGDSSLNFVLRCFLPSLENRLTAIHELHMTIDRTFREAAIEFAFPTQDVHVRSVNLGPGVLEAMAGHQTPPAFGVTGPELERAA